MADASHCKDKRFYWITYGSDSMNTKDTVEKLEFQSPCGNYLAILTGRHELEFVFADNRHPARHLRALSVLYGFFHDPLTIELQGDFAVTHVTQTLPDTPSIRVLGLGYDTANWSCRIPNLHKA